MIRSIWFIVAASFFTFVFSSLAILSGLISPYSDFSNWVVRTWAKTLLKVGGIKLQISGLEKIDPNQSYVFIQNHQSSFDILASSVSIPGTARFLAKAELFRIPVFAQGMRLVGMLEINRGNSQKSRRTIQKAINTVKSGVSVIIYPEGTRSRDGNIQPFKKGGFILAIEAQIPIVPVVISGSWEIMSKTSLRLHRGTIQIHFLDPVPTAGMDLTHRGRLMTDVHQAMVEKFNLLQGKTTHGL
jgi:1-acyl-sn-glycerol-3-phosphate acyltransferase